MAAVDVRWIQRLQNFEKALAQLDETVTLMRQRTLSNLEKQGVFQVFKCSYELGWNTLKDYLVWGSSRLSARGIPYVRPFRWD